MTERSLRRAPLALLALATLLRIAAAVALGDGFYFSDETEYVDAADRLRAGGGFAPGYARVPAFPLVLAPLRAVAPDDLRAVRILHGVLAAGGTVVVIAVGRRLLGTRAALVGAALYAVDPMMVAAGGLLYPEATAAVVLLVALLFALGAVHDDRPWRAGAAGAALGVLAQLRPVGLVLVPALAAWIAVVVRTTGPRRAAHVAAVLAGAVLALAPWTYRGYRVHGAVVPIATEGTAAAPVARERVASQGLTASLLEEAWKEPGPLFCRVAREFGHFFELYPQRITTDNREGRAELHGRDARLPLTSAVPAEPRDVVSVLTFVPELLLAAVGLFAGWRDRRSAVLLLAGGTVCYGLGYALFIGKLRYRIPVLPLLFLLAGHGVVTLARLRRSARAA